MPERARDRASGDPSSPQRRAASAAGAGARETRVDTLMRLQRIAGNRATRALLAGGETSLARSVASPRIMRSWVPKSGGGDKWVPVGSRTWERRVAGSGYEYRFINEGSSTMDSEHELDWKTGTQWEQLGIALPDAAPTTTSSSSSTTQTLPVATGGAWDVETFMEVVQSQGLAGVCNSVTAAYLTNLIAPAPDGTGVHERNYESVAVLKHMLDEIVGYFHDGSDSADVTRAFVAWARRTGINGAWFESLSSSTVDSRYRDFREFFRDFRNEGVPARTARAEGRFEDLTAEYLYSEFDELLEPFFSMNTPFHGTIVIKADVMKEDADALDRNYEPSGHEFAIRYDPNGFVFSIYDQNAGLVQQNIREQEEIAEILANYLHRNYIENPMPAARSSGGQGRTNHGSFEMQVFR